MSVAVSLPCQKRGFRVLDSGYLRGKAMRLALPKLIAVTVLFTSLGCVAQTMVEPQVAATDQGKTSTESRPLFGVATSIPVQREKIRIGPGDLLEVSLYGVPDYHQETRVNDTGDLPLPLIGSVRVGGATVDEAQDAIAAQLVEGGYFRDPHVSVLIKDFASQGVSVLGEVVRPGVYPMVGTRRLYDLLSLAGGLTNKAGKLVSITHRDQPKSSDQVLMSSDPSKSIESNVEVFPGDTIVISKAGIVYVVGDVQRPGGFVMENNDHMTVLEAVALAQGTNRTAALGKARILRRSSAGTTELNVPLKQMMAAKSNDMDMMAEDILFIPGSAAKNAFGRGVESVFQVATSLAIYGVH